MGKKIQSLLLRHEYLIWILCFCALLRLPSFLEPYWYGDEGIYLTLGQAIRKGLHLYKDIHDNKPPLLYFMAALTGSVFWFRFFLFFWNSVSIIIFERLSHLLLDTNENPGKTIIGGIEFPKVQYSTIATALFAFLPFFVEGAIANGEIFMVLPTLLGFYFLLKGKNTREILLSGFFFTLAFLIKVPALFDAAAAGVFFFLIVPIFHEKMTKPKEFVMRQGKQILLFSVAFLLPIILTLVYYASLGAGKQYIIAAFAQNVGYLSSWQTGSHEAQNLGESGLKTRAIILVLGLLAVVALTKKNGRTLTLLLLWFAFALFGALLSERPYPHYLIQIVAPLSLLLVIFVQFLQHRQPKNTPSSFSLFPSISRFIPPVTIATTFAIFIVSLISIQFWYYPLLPYYKNYIMRMTGNKSQEEYLRYFDPKLPDVYNAATFVTGATTSDERIFIWGDVPGLYALSRRLPPGRFTSAYHIKDFNGSQETAQAIEHHELKYIFIDTTYEKPFVALQDILELQYMKSREIGHIDVYKRMK